VSSLEYEVYPELAQKEGEKIIQEALTKFDIVDVYCVHREGHLQIGEMAVWVIATSEHRENAFLACQYIIDEVKARVPIGRKNIMLIKKPFGFDAINALITNITEVTNGSTPVKLF
jgi:molybdopterin synthase catalytic subunit